MSEQLYLQIAENVDKNFQTAPKAGDELSQAFIAYLKIVSTPEEAQVVQHMFMFPVFKTLEELAEAAVDAEKCIGCGVCAVACPTEALKRHRMDRPEKPFDTDIEWYMTVAQDNNRL